MDWREKDRDQRDQKDTGKGLEKVREGIGEEEGKGTKEKDGNMD